MGGINKVTDNIVFVEFKRKEDLTDYYRAADLFVLPTREDIWGLVVNEAMAVGTPVITTTNCGAGMEILKSGDGGRIVPPEDSDSLAIAMQEMLNDDELAKQTKHAIKSAEVYTIENMAKRVAEVIRNIC
mgnify:CR=1 FL=1